MIKQKQYETMILSPKNGSITSQRSVADQKSRSFPPLWRPQCHPLSASLECLASPRRCDTPEVKSCRFRKEMEGICHDLGKCFFFFFGGGVGIYINHRNHLAIMNHECTSVWFLDLFGILYFMQNLHLTNT